MCLSTTNKRSYPSCYFSPNVTFVLETPSFVHFQGFDLLQVVEAKYYNVKIGDRQCKNIAVTMNEITCLPPKSEPNDPNSTHTMVKVHVLIHLQLRGDSLTTGGWGLKNWAKCVSFIL